jgi:hypothetical protein
LRHAVLIEVTRKNQPTEHSPSRYFGIPFEPWHGRNTCYFPLILRVLLLYSTKLLCNCRPFGFTLTFARRLLHFFGEFPDSPEEPGGFDCRSSLLKPASELTENLDFVAA